MDTITLTAFESSPDRGRGLARDMRVRWALEELGLPYQVRLLSFAALKQPDHLRLQPFGQIPSFEQGDVALFESGAIVLHLAQQHPGLLPGEPAARARAMAWLFAALNTVEPPILELQNAVLLEHDRPWAAARLPLLHERIRARLQELARHLGDGDWLEGTFSAGDLMMIGVLHRVDGLPLLDELPTLKAYLDRGRARPAWQRAFEAQRQVFLAASGSR